VSLFFNCYIIIHNQFAEIKMKYLSLDKKASHSLNFIFFMDTDTTPTKLTLGSTVAYMEQVQQ
jgi:hypothetical protein